MYARLYALGESPLAIDEYYLAQSIRNILESGFPRFDCGGYYVRGLIQQYSTAVLNIVGIDMHVALRMITVLANIAAIPAVYLLGKRVGGFNAAVCACILFALSVWEIEIARFGRMYAPFQAIFVWYCVALCRAYFGSHRGFYWSVVLGTISIFVYEGAALLLCTTFIPLVAGKVQRVKNWLLAGSSFVFGIWFLTRDFGTLGAEPRLSERYNDQSTTPWNLPFDEPLTLFSPAWSGAFEILMLIGAVCFSVIFVVNMARSISTGMRSQTDGIAYLWLGVAIWLAAGGFFGIILMLSVALIAWRWLDFNQLSRTTVVTVCIWLIIALTAWIARLLTVSEGPVAERGVEILYILFLFPDVYSEIAYRWLRSLPVESVVAVVSIGAYLLALRHDDQKSNAAELFLFLLGLLLVLGFMVAILPQPYSTIRYTYFLHPLVIVLIATSWAAIANKFTANESRQTVVILGATCLFMIASFDYRISHIVGIGSPEIIFRMNMSKWERDRVYRRWDYRSPAEYVNSHATPSDKIVTTSQSVPYYLNNLTHFYMNSSGKEYATVASCHGTMERWSSATLLSTPAELRQLYEPKIRNDVWAIIRSPIRPEASSMEQAIAREHKDHIVYESVDERIIVVHIPAENSRVSNPQ